MIFYGYIIFSYRGPHNLFNRCHILDISVVFNIPPTSLGIVLYLYLYVSLLIFLENKVLEVEFMGQ